MGLLISSVFRLKVSGEKVVGAVRFELTTSCTRNKRATRLRYAPPLSPKRAGKLQGLQLKSVEAQGRWAARKVGAAITQMHSSSRLTGPTISTVFVAPARRGS